MRRVKSDPPPVVVDLHPGVRRPFATEQTGDIPRGEPAMAAYRQHHVRVILAHAAALRERLLGGGANRGGTRRVDEGLEHLIHGRPSLIERRGIVRQPLQSGAADRDQRLDGRAGNGERRIETVQGPVTFRLDMRVVHECDAGDPVIEHRVRFRDEPGAHHGVEGIDGRFEFGMRFHHDIDVHDLLAWSGHGDATQLETMVRDRQAEAQLHLVIKHQYRSLAKEP